VTGYASPIMNTRYRVTPYRVTPYRVMPYRVTVFRPMRPQ